MVSGRPQFFGLMASTRGTNKVIHYANPVHAFFLSTKDAMPNRKQSAMIAVQSTLRPSNAAMTKPALYFGMVGGRECTNPYSHYTTRELTVFGTCGAQRQKGSNFTRSPLRNSQRPLCRRRNRPEILAKRVMVANNLEGRSPIWQAMQSLPATRPTNGTCVDAPSSGIHIRTVPEVGIRLRRTIQTTDDVHRK